MEESLVARLMASAAVAAIVSDRIHWSIKPQGQSYPSLLLTVVSPGSQDIYSGRGGLRGGRIQFDCEGPSYGAAKALARAVDAEMALPAVVGAAWFRAASLAGERDSAGQIGTQMIFRTSLDLMVWHSPA